MQYGIVTGFIFFIDFFLKKKADGLKRLGKWRSYWNDRIEVWKYHNHGGFYNLGNFLRAVGSGICVFPFIPYLSWKPDVKKRSFHSVGRSFQ